MKQSEKSNITQQRVKAAAEKLFGQKGYDETTMQDIINEAGVSRGAIYHQYESKQEILKSLTRDAQEKVKELFVSLAGNKSQSAKEKLFTIIEYLNTSSRQASLIGLRWAEKVPFALLDNLRYGMREYAPLLEHILDTGVKNGEYECTKPDMAAEIILLLTDIWLDPTIFGWNEEQANKRVGALLDILAHMAKGLLTQDDRSRIALSAYSAGREEA